MSAVSDEENAQPVTGQHLPPMVCSSDARLIDKQLWEHPGGPADAPRINKKRRPRFDFYTTYEQETVEYGAKYMQK